MYSYDMLSELVGSCCIIQTVYRAFSLNKSSRQDALMKQSDMLSKWSQRTWTNHSFNTKIATTRNFC